MLMEAYSAVLGVRWEDTLEEGELWGDDDQADVEAAMASAFGACVLCCLSVVGGFSVRS